MQPNQTYHKSEANSSQQIHHTPNRILITWAWTWNAPSVMHPSVMPLQLYTPRKRVKKMDHTNCESLNVECERRSKMTQMFTHPLTFFLIHVHTHLPSIPPRPPPDQSLAADPMLHPAPTPLHRNTRVSKPPESMIFLPLYHWQQL